MAEPLKINWPVPDGGMNLSLPATHLPMDQAVLIQDGEFVREDRNYPRKPGLRSRNPSRALVTPNGSATHSPGSIYVWGNMKAQKYWLIVSTDEDTRLRAYPLDKDVNGRLTVGSATVLSTARSDDMNTYAVYNDVLYITNAVDGLASWDGTTYALIAAAPKARFVKAWQDQLWLANGGASDRSRLWSSDIGDPTTWPALNFVDMGKGDGDDCSGIFIEGQSMVVGKNTKTFLMYDQFTFANRLLDYEKGLRGHNSVVKYGGVTYYASGNDIVAFNPDGPAQIISDNIASIMDTHGQGGGGYTGSDPQGYVWKNRVGWSTWDYNNNPRIVEFYPDMTKKPWVVHHHGANGFARVYGALSISPAGNQPIADVLVAIHNTGINVITMFEPTTIRGVNDADGDPVRFTITTPIFSPEGDWSAQYEVDQMIFLTAGPDSKVTVRLMNDRIDSLFAAATKTIPAFTFSGQYRTVTRIDQELYAWVYGDASLVGTGPAFVSNWGTFLQFVFENLVNTVVDRGPPIFSGAQIVLIKGSQSE